MVNSENNKTTTIQLSRGNFLKFLKDKGEDSFLKGMPFLDLKGDKVDLLISCGDGYVARLPIERLKIQDYIKFRYSEEK